MQEKIESINTLYEEKAKTVTDKRDAEIEAIEASRTAS